MEDRTRVIHVRILMVPPRYGSELVGGAENLMGALARHAAAAGMDVEVATTCAADTATWANRLPAGETLEGGLVVRRFPVTPRDARRHGQLATQLAHGAGLSALDEADLLATSVWSEELQRFIDRHGRDFDAILFTPYLFGTTFWGAQSWPERTAIIPCLHDEPYAHLKCVQEVLRAVPLLLYNARGEQRLAQRLLGSTGGVVVGMGFDTPAAPAVPGFARRHGLGEYVLYAGRLEEGKRVDVAARYVADFARRHDSNIKLAVIGSGPWEPAPEIADSVEMLGFVSADEKRSAMAEAVALVNPSELESFSIVLLEAWLEGTPAIVAAGSEVMADHCSDSGGGFTFRDQPDFDRALLTLLDSPGDRVAMGERGREYVESRYSWSKVMSRFEQALSAFS